tara:strand:- start:769 stop:1077 length:309 start_codon:yes stop_codon:yes gene_type:complete
MNEVYNLRIGDMVWNTQDTTGEVSNIVGLVYKLTPKYAYYAVCARLRDDPNGDHFITRDHKVKKSRLYDSIKKKQVEISYAGGTKRRRRITDEEMLPRYVSC